MPKFKSWREMIINRNISIVDLLKEVLKFIIPFRSPIVKTFVDEIVAEWLNSLADIKTLLELLDGFFSFNEAAHALAVATVHHLYQG
jgi:hypothetical protein